MTTTALFSSTFAINYNIFSVIRVLRYLLSTQTISTDKKTNKMAKLKIFKNLNCILRILTIFFAESSLSLSSEVMVSSLNVGNKSEREKERDRVEIMFSKITFRHKEL